ncbi:MAG: hypothetical protein QM751_12955 [Paludibacteraceae bacterium]
MQWIKTPARLYVDGFGDCKSMALFACSCLRCLGIRHYFRFVSFNREKEATHVYAVAIDMRGNEIYIDPVVRPIRFNYQEKYTYKVDMNGTQIYKLAGINKRKNTTRFIGSTTPSRQFDVDFGDASAITPELMSMYARRDLLLESKRIATSQLELDTLNESLAQQDTEIAKARSFSSISGGLDALSAKKMADHMKKSGMYYIYTYFKNQDTLQLKIRRKIRTQSQMFYYFEDVDIWHNTSACNDLARSGIIASTGMQPEQFLEYIQTNDAKIAGVGAIMAVIGVISAIISLIKLIVDLFGGGSRQAPSDAEINAALADTATDFPKSGSSSSSAGSNLLSGTNSILYIGIFTAAAMLLLRKKNKN